ncbi:MAG: RNase adapter RapZ [Actinobacteria bacterium]|nr:RNase adapter RapZ [Actinomycetota bacterium]
MTHDPATRGRQPGTAHPVPARATRARRPRRAPTEPTESNPAFTIITGLSGAGRSEASRCLEDLGYFVVDNLPPTLLGKMAELASSPGGPGRVAIVLDVRGGVFFGELSRALDELRELEVASRILFLEASDQDLVNRYESTRRRHPLAPADRVVEGIRKERLMMESLRGEADLIIDTSGLTPHELRDKIRDAFADAPPEESLQVSLISFGYKYGAPRDADLVIDCRFLPNPHWIDELRPLPGTDDRVRTYVRGQQAYREFLRRLRSLLGFMVPGFVAEGKAYLTIAVGCTGGRHRSVVVVEDLATFFRDKGLAATVDHRDLDR